jgi:hypothetical protein
MRTIFVSLWLVVSMLTGVSAIASPKPQPSAGRSAAQYSLERQLANQLTYPTALGFSTMDRVLVIRFRVNDDQRLVQLNVFSDNVRLNDELTRQLINAKLALPAAGSDQVYTVRLHFAANR